MIAYIFEYDETGTIFKTIYYDVPVVPAQPVTAGREILVVEASGLLQEEIDRANQARMFPHLFQVVDGELVER